MYSFDGEPFRQCLGSGKHTTRVQEEDIAGGAQTAVTGTVANIFLHNQTSETRLVTDAQLLLPFKADIENLIR